MFEFCKKNGLFILTLLLLISTIYIFYRDFKNSHRQLTFAMLDVGQGDALFVESPTGTQILIDVGPPRRILGPLSKMMGAFDRHLDAVIVTNPDQDHIGGFSDLLKVYKVGMVLESGTLSDSKTFQNLKEEIKEKNIQNILARKGLRLHLGGGAFIDIIFPDRGVRAWSTNDGSVVARLVYGNTSILLTGDSTSTTEKFILEANSDAEIDSDILKVGHHGSRTSTSIPFVEAVTPAYALISLGEDNSYGHPHPDTLKTLASLGVKVFRTDLLGNIVMKSDGKKETFSFHR